MEQSPVTPKNQIAESIHLFSSVEILFTYYFNVTLISPVTLLFLAIKLHTLENTPYG